MWWWTLHSMTPRGPDWWPAVTTRARTASSLRVSRRHGVRCVVGATALAQRLRLPEVWDCCVAVAAFAWAPRVLVLPPSRDGVRWNYPGQDAYTADHLVRSRLARDYREEWSVCENT